MTVDHEMLVGEHVQGDSARVDSVQTVLHRSEMWTKLVDIISFKKDGKNMSD
jgi:hypothetical protein